MIISHEHKFIFIKTSKTAGTSTEIALSRFCGPHDVITRICPQDQEIRRQLGGIGPQNHLSPLWEYVPRDFVKLLRKRRPKYKFSNHDSAAKIRARIDPQQWATYFKFCIARNPWDRVISSYFWRMRDQASPTSLPAFVDSAAIQYLMRTGFNLYTIDGKVVVDNICHYETLAEDLEAVRIYLGLPERLELPFAKAHYRPARSKYRDLLDENRRLRIADVFRDEIDLLGYEY